MNLVPQQFLQAILMLQQDITEIKKKDTVKEKDRKGGQHQH